MCQIKYEIALKHINNHKDRLKIYLINITVNNKNPIIVIICF